MRKTKKNIEDAIGVVFDQRDRIFTLERELAEARKQADLLLWVNGNAGKQLQEFGDEVNSRGARIVDLQERLAMALEALTKIANGGVEDITAFCGLEPGDCALVCNWCGDASYPIEHADGCPVRIAEAALTATAASVAQHTASVEARAIQKCQRCVTPQQLAEIMHETYERQALIEGWTTQESCRVPFAELPEANKRVMLAVAKAVLWATPDLSKMEAEVERRGALKALDKLLSTLSPDGLPWMPKYPYELHHAVENLKRAAELEGA